MLRDELAACHREIDRLLNEGAAMATMLTSVERWMSGYGTKTQGEMRQEVRAIIGATST
ncbi:MAG TPA: hypothetical protein VGT79_02755 [Xanthomonadaceae bacterium]|nr:hypothetical protein [Xanthomonadaceae bacterium]